MSVVGGEMATPDRIKYIQGQMRIAIQNHQVLWQRLVYKPQDSDVENMLRMLQSIIMSLGRRQTELMYEYKRDLRLKYPGDEEMQKKISIQQLGWPDRNDPIKKHMPNGSSTDPGKKPTPQLVKKNPNMQLVRPGQKMTSLLKPPIGSANQQLQRKESERLKAAAAKQAESAAPVISKKTGPGQKPKIVLKVLPSSRRISNEKLSDSDSFPELKESELAGYKLTPQDKATELTELSQDQYLEFFGLVHKEKSKSMVVSQKKRKRRSAAGQSDFYKDFFQPKRPYNRKTAMADNESPSSSQELTEVGSTEFSPPSEKPSVPPSPVSSCSTEVIEESTPREGSPTVIEASEDLGEGGSQSEEVDKPVETGDTPDELLPIGEPSEAVRNGDSAPKESSNSTAAAAAEKALSTAEKALSADEEPLVEDPAATVGESQSAAVGESRSAAVGESQSAAVGESQSAAVGESQSAAAGDSQSAAAGDSQSAAAGESLSAAAGESLSAIDVSLTVSEKPTCTAEESVGGAPSSDKDTPVTGEAQDFACKEPSAESGETPFGAAELDTPLEESKLEDPTKTDDGPCRTPPDDSAPPSPADEDDEDGAPPSSTNEDDEDIDSSLSPSDLIESETYTVPSTVNPSGKIESVSSVGEESNGGDVGVDISAMIGDVQYVPAEGADCSEMLINRYRPEGHAEESEVDVEEEEEDDDTSVDDDEESSSGT